MARRDRSSKRSERGRSRKHEYKPRSAEQNKRRQQQSGSDRDNIIDPDIMMFHPKEGSNHLRVLPPTWDDPDHFGYDTYVHYGIGPDKASYLSLSKMKGEEDPIDEEYRRANKEGDEDYAKQLKPNKRILIFVVDRKDEESGPKLWSCPWTIDQDLAKLAYDDRTGELLNIDDPEAGYDISFDRNGTGRNTRYEATSISRRPSPLSDDDNEMDTWLDFVEEHPIPSTLIFHDYDYIKEAFEGTAKQSDDDEEEEKPSRSRGRDDEEKEERPSRRSRRSSRDQDDEDEKEDELDWKTIHKMGFDDLDDLLDSNKQLKSFDEDPEDFDDPEELADAICEYLEIKEHKSHRSSRGSARSSRRRLRDEEDE